MPVPSSISDLSTTAGSNYPGGGESPITADDYFRAHASFIAQMAGLYSVAGSSTPVAYQLWADTTAGSLKIRNGANSAWIVLGPLSSPVVRQGHIAGLIPSTAGSSATITVSAGEATDGTNAETLVLASAISKTTSAWAVGSTNGGLDTGTIANSTGYYVWLIKRPDTGVVDALLSLSATAPTMPANYTLKRLIGYAKTTGSALWIKFTAYETAGGGIRHIWGAALTQDITVASSVNTRVLQALSVVPIGVSVTALMRAYLSHSAAIAVVICSPDEVDAAPNVAGAPLANLRLAASGDTACDLEIQTDTSGQVAFRCSATTAVLRGVTRGFEWSRR